MAREKTHTAPEFDTPEWARWIAQDQDGTWWAYEVEPLQFHKGWYENEVGRIQKLTTDQPTDLWKDQLFKLPVAQSFNHSLSELPQVSLQSLWKKCEAPSGDITFANGDIIDLKEHWCRKSYSILTKTTLEKTIAEYGEGTTIEVLGSTINPNSGHIAYRGEGSMGNEGFVAYADKNGTLFWLIFLDFSNPFWDIHFKGDCIIATTELECEFSIPINNPEKLSCSKCNKWEKSYSEKAEKEYLQNQK